MTVHKIQDCNLWPGFTSIFLKVIRGYLWKLWEFGPICDFQLTKLKTAFVDYVKVPDIDETRVLLSLIPDRIGHGTCIHPENGGADDLVNIVEKHLIPIGKYFSTH